MTSKELGHIVKPINMLAGGAYTTTQTSSALDTLGYESAYIVISGMAWTSGGLFTPSLVECDTVGGTYAAPSGAGQGGVAETSMIEWFLDGVPQGLTVPLLDSVADAAHVIGVSYVGGQRRFLKIVMTQSGGASVGTTFGIVGLLGHPREVGAKAYSNWNT